MFRDRPGNILVPAARGMDEVLDLFRGTRHRKLQAGGTPFHPAVQRVQFRPVCRACILLNQLRSGERAGFEYLFDRVGTLHESAGLQNESPLGLNFRILLCPETLFSFLRNVNRGGIGLEPRGHPPQEPLFEG